VTATSSAQQPLCPDSHRCSAAEDLACQTDICTDPTCPELDCDGCFDYDKYCADCTGDNQEDCEQCSEHDAHCQDCFDDCTSECDLPLTDCGEACCLDHDYAPAGSYSEFFGSQTADMFGPSVASPRFPSRLHPDANRAILYPDERLEPAASVPERVPQISVGGSARTLVSSAIQQPLSGLDLLQAVGSACINASQFQGVSPTSLDDFIKPSIGIKAALAAVKDIPKASSVYSSFHNDHLDASRPLTSASPKSSSLAFEKPASPISKGPPTEVLSCRWADAPGEPCGQVFYLAEDLHNHLREAHNTRSDVFCRWIGCPVSAFSDNPHRYANSVQRHTWGHSGYRPYKCLACGEGFAAANVRDEHFSNIHLKKKLFCCDVCGHQCTSATNLKRHNDERHRAERFQCEYCNRNGKIRLFPRGPNLARHFRKCKYVLLSFPEAIGAVEGKIEDAWYPPGYKKGHHGMDKAKITPPNFLPN